LEDCLPISDAIISGVSDPTFQVPTKLIKKGSVCLDLTAHNFDKEAVALHASSFASEFGRVTMAMLYSNLLVSDTGTA
jgi:methylenetetrahydrofolate dehydrogenase (NAD+)